jgi:ankyrin repeat protein
VSIVEKLLKFGASPDAFDLEGQSPLHLAIRGGHAVVAKRLLQAGADPNLRDRKVKTGSCKP